MTTAPIEWGRIEWQPTLILYHGDCPDGFTAAWIADQAIPGIRLIPCRHGAAPPPVVGERVLILDFSFPKDRLLALAEEADELLLLDHHVSAQRVLGDLEFCRFDLERSGATLAWDHFHPGRPRPQLVSYIEDRDLWRNRLEGSHEVATWIRSYPMELETWSEMARWLEEHHGEVLSEGAAILRAQNRCIAIMAKQERRRSFAGFENVAVINASAHSSELGNELANQASFAVIWRELADGQVACELRGAAHSPDLSALATRMGGGGHARAAGFRSASVEEFRRLLGPIQEPESEG